MTGSVSTICMNEGAAASSCTTLVTCNSVAHRHRGVGLHHKQGIGCGGVAVGRGRIVLHIKAGGFQVRIHTRYNGFDGVGARLDCCPRALNGANGSGSRQTNNQQTSHDEDVFIEHLKF